MKKFICIVLIVVIAALVGYKVYPMINSDKNIEEESNSTEVAGTTVEEKEEEKESKEKSELSNDSIYKEVIDSYKNAYKEYDLEDFESEDKILAKYDMVSITLIEHVLRYEEDGVSLTYEFYDIDKNGIDELIIGASGAPGAIYSYDEEDSKVVKVFFQDTMERGDLSIFDNGTIVSSGAGGAALHYYEFGKISKEDSSYELLEKIEEEYEMENEKPTYRDTETSKVLSYKSYDEIADKYLKDANKVELKDYSIIK